MRKRVEQDYETELKLELTRDVYEAILGKCPEFRPPVTQRNSFFDTADRVLRENHWALRLREEGQEYFLTAKGPTVRDGNGVFERPEFECRIGAEGADFYYAGFSLSRCSEKPCVVLRGRFGDIFVGLMFSFRNERRFVAFREWELEIDKTTASNEIAYELEIEVRREQAKSLETEVRSWFGEENWRYRPSKSTKMEWAERIFNRETRPP